MALEQGTITAGDLEFGYLADGPADGPLALCLHGFPDSAWTWRHLLPALAGAGYRAVAPFLRGYAPDRGAGRRPLPGPALGPRREQPARGARRRRRRRPHRPRLGRHRRLPGGVAPSPTAGAKVVTMAVPPGIAMGGFLAYDQIKRSFYMWFFQLPLADMVVPVNDMAFIDRLWADWSPGYDGAEDVDHVQASRWASPSQPRRRPRLLPGDVRRHGAGAGRRSCPAIAAAAGQSRPSRCCTCTAATTAASVSRWPRTPQRCSQGTPRRRSSTAPATSSSWRSRTRSTAASWSSSRS